MDCKYTSNDADFVKPNKYIILKNKKVKTLPLKPWPLPKFKPFLVKYFYTYSTPNLPPNIDYINPLILFKLI